MSVLLQGLSIPDGNPRTINIYRDGAWCDAYTTENGKAVEVPAPHGRLIDADDLENITVIMNENGTGFNRIVAPTIIEAEDGET